MAWVKTITTYLPPFTIQDEYVVCAWKFSFGILKQKKFKFQRKTPIKIGLANPNLRGKEEPKGSR